MLGSSPPLAVFLLLGAVTSCRGSADIVADAAGDYDPKHPPQMLPLSGDLELHDPTLFRAAGQYWVYSSGLGLAAKSSDDMRIFKNEPSIFDENPSWIAELLPDVTGLWSPTVGSFGDKIHLYYAASTFGSNRSCIGHAVAAGPSADFLDQGPVVCSNLTDVPEDFNAIDPGLFVDTDGSPWLVFGSFGSGIKLVALDSTGKRRNTEMISLATRSSDPPAIQASSLMKRGNYYYLFVSFDLCCRGAESTHHLVAGRAQEVTGPYIDRDGRDLRSGGGSVLLASGPRWRGPGSNMVHVEDQKRYNVFHAYDADANGRPTLRIGELYFDNDGWPVTAGP